LQALALLNDEVFVEAAQKLGKAAASLDCDEEGRIQFLFRRCLTRPASAEEAERIARFYRAQRERLARGELSPEDLGAEAGERAGECAAWTAVARALLNLDETVTRG
jgi:hypothetical protein